MRHDSHFVDALTEHFGESLGRYVPLSEIVPNPDQPRQNVGDLEELKASIESKGVLEPILVRPTDTGKFQIISGERRYRAAIKAGLTEIPCLEMNVSDSEVLEIALIENLHRKDLTPFEEADGYQALIDRFSYTHQKLAETVAKSRVGITESLTLTRIPESIRERCRRADIGSKSLLLQVARAETAGEMEKVVKRILSGATREDLRESKREEGDRPKRARAFSFRYAPKDSPFRLSLAFNRSRVAKQEIVEALEKILSEVRSGAFDPKPLKKK
jgi:ParB family chromosome partitioning protein